MSKLTNNFKTEFEYLLFSANKEKDDKVKSKLILDKSLYLLNSSVALNHSTATTSQLLYDEYKEYQNVINERTVDNFSGEFIELLKPLSSKFKTIEWKSSLNENTSFDKFFPQTNKTPCKYQKLSDSDIKSFFKSSEYNDSAEESQLNKDPIKLDNFNNIQSTEMKLPSPIHSEIINNQSNNKVKTNISNNISINKPSKFVFRPPIVSATNTSTKNVIASTSHHNNDENACENESKKYFIGNNRLHTMTPTNSSFATPPQPPTTNKFSDFCTGNDLMRKLNAIKGNASSSSMEHQPFAYESTSRKSLGGRVTVQSKFVPPFKQMKHSNDERYGDCGADNGECEESQIFDERLKNIDPKMIKLIENEIMDKFSSIGWDDIAGLEYAKSTIKEAVVYPLLRPDIFTGLRRPPRGILLFGPPGTGKTLIGKCIASQSKSTFFSISASSLTSKWIGDGEKMVRALFAVASVHQPAVIFIDEIDSLLIQRSDTEHESSRRIKTEFLVQLDGATTADDEQVLIVGATNRPQELDEAARRRLVKRLYIPLPEFPARIQILKNLLKTERHNITDDELDKIGNLTNGFSGADMKTLCHEALMGPIRSIPITEMLSIKADAVRSVNFNDFTVALKHVRASVSQNDLIQYINWDKQYGSGISF